MIIAYLKKTIIKLTMAILIRISDTRLFYEKRKSYIGAEEELRKGSCSETMRRMENVVEELVARQTELLEELGGQLDSSGTSNSDGRLAPSAGPAASERRKIGRYAPGEDRQLCDVFGQAEGRAGDVAGVRIEESLDRRAAAVEDEQTLRTSVCR